MNAWEEIRAAKRQQKLERNGACAPSKISSKRNGLTSYAEKAAKARETLAPGPPRDRLKAFEARCLSRAIAANDDAWAAKYDTPVDH